MWVGELDMDDDAVVRDWWEAGRAGAEHERPFATFWPFETARATLRDTGEAFERLALVVIDGETVVGGSYLLLPARDNTHLAMAAPIVHPAHRRRGAGSALLEHGIAIARARGRTTMLVEVDRPLAGAEPAESPGSLFLARHGFTEASREIHRVLGLPVSAAQLDALDAETLPHRDGYRLVPFADRVPDALVDGYCALQASFNEEAPTGDLDLEPEVWDEDRVRETEARLARQGRHPRGVGAVAPDGEVVGLTEMIASRHHPEYALQGATLVHPRHRGHRLGLATKVANLRAFQAEFPAVTRVHSWNGAANGPMVAINERLGFAPVEVLSEMQRRL